MLFAMAALLFTLWIFGLGSGAALGSWVHLLLLLALGSFAFAAAFAHARARQPIGPRPRAKPAVIP